MDDGGIPFVYRHGIGRKVAGNREMFIAIFNPFYSSASSKTRGNYDREIKKVRTRMTRYAIF